MSSAQTSQSALVEYLLTVDTPTLCNAIEQLTLRPRHEGFHTPGNSFSVPRDGPDLRLGSNGPSGDG